MDGIIVINKTKGCTSHDIVYKVKKILKEKVGHTGTLDPNATGVLPLLIGEGTKLSKYLIEHDKIYKATIFLGKETTTLDVEGEVIKEKEVDFKKLTFENVNEVLNSFLGKQEQIPPIYSAIKVNGKKLYDYARNGQEVEIKPRIIEIYDIKLDSIDENRITYTVKCSKGTYIRTLCKDIAEKLDTVGYMEDLQRQEVGKFNIKDSITVEELEKNINSKEFFDKNFISIEKFFNEKEKLQLNEKGLNLFLNGVRLTRNIKEDLYRIYDINNNFIGIGIVEKNLLKREIIL